MTVLVTGGAGFIGSHIVDALIQQGHKVVVVDNLSTGSEENINPAAKFYHMSICDDELKKVFQQEKPEMVSHHAAQAVVIKSMSEPLFDAEQNILGSLNVIHNCMEFNVNKIIYASSGGAVYGEPSYHPVDENHATNPISYYGVSKQTIERYLSIYSSRYGLNYVALRYANVYGPRQNPHAEAGVVAIFTQLMLKGEKPTIFGSGDKTRDYIDIRDVVTAHLLAINNGSNTILNIGTGVETSDQELFNVIAALLEFDLPPQYALFRQGEVSRINLNCSKAARELGWKPNITLKDGLTETVNYYKRLYESN